MLGTSFSDDYAATGFGGDLALPIIRDRWRADLPEAEARAILEDCLRVLWYRDTRALNKVQIATISAAGTVISEPYSLSAKWDFAAFVKPKAGSLSCMADPSSSQTWGRRAPGQVVGS